MMEKSKLAISPQLEHEILKNLQTFILFFPDSAEALRQQLGADDLPNIPYFDRKIKARLDQLEDLDFPGHPRQPKA